MPDLSWEEVCCQELEQGGPEKSLTTTPKLGTWDGWVGGRTAAQTRKHKAQWSGS